VGDGVEGIRAWQRGLDAQRGCDLTSGACRALLFRDGIQEGQGRRWASF
jgi:hypothetical protein